MGSGGSFVCARAIPLFSELKYCTAKREKTARAHHISRIRGTPPRSEIPLRPNVLWPPAQAPPPRGFCPGGRALRPGGGGRESGGEGRGQRGPQDTYGGLRIFLSTGARVEGRGRFTSGPFFGSGSTVQNFPDSLSYFSFPGPEIPGDSLRTNGEAVGTQPTGPATRVGWVPGVLCGSNGMSGLNGGAGQRVARLPQFG